MAFTAFFHISCSKCQSQLPSWACQKPKRGWLCLPATGTRKHKMILHHPWSSPSPQRETSSSRYSGQTHGRILDSSFLPTPNPIQPLCKPSQFCLQNISQIQPLLSTTLVQGTAFPRWGRCSSLLLTGPLLPLLLPFNLLLRDSVKTKALLSSKSSTVPRHSH